ncbi:hypothetical protein Rsub_11514 [Raphidocelis subcapitata]|uniref:Uncharacterized protein n=1 Tax=Raphidocelis subcapitata TaxID=307507 RepID=A0A2V0PKJ3_9CHLO|nr:hypothetical protein Rsub_11514 [Raphidocelis subcapitata]|eukprot:GBF98523.1 hypothetical protein Rsub_11514 [Raphidocelis subcapitata]
MQPATPAAAALAQPAAPDAVAARAAVAAQFERLAQEAVRRRRRWADEGPMLESYIAALGSTCAIIRAEQARVSRELAELADGLARRADAASGAQVPPLPPSEQQEQQQQQQQQQQQTLAGDDSVELATRLAEVQGRLRRLEADLGAVRPLLAASRPEERDIHETKLVVLQDTKRLLQEESDHLHSELQRRDAAARLSAESARVGSAQLASAADLGRLQEQLAATEARLDRAKQLFYFPESEGFRFRAGGAGVFFAAKDLHISDVSAAVSLSLAPAPPARPGAPRRARLAVSLGGAAGGPGTAGQRAGSAVGAVGAAVTAAEAARAAAAERAESARQAAVRAARQQPGAAASGAGAAAGRGGAGERSGGGGGAGGDWSDDLPSGIGPGRKGRRVARFLDGLSDRKEQLKGRITAAAAAAAAASSHGGAGETQPRSGLNRIASALAERARSHTLPASAADGGKGTPQPAAQPAAADDAGDASPGAASSGRGAAASPGQASMPAAQAGAGGTAPGGGSPGLRASHGLGEAIERLSLDGPAAAELKQNRGQCSQPARLSSGVEQARGRFRNLRSRLLDAKLSDSHTLSEAKSRLAGGAASFKRHLNAAVDRLHVEGGGGQVYGGSSSASHSGAAGWQEVAPQAGQLQQGQQQQRGQQQQEGAGRAQQEAGQQPAEQQQGGEQGAEHQWEQSHPGADEAGELEQQQEQQRAQQHEQQQQEAGSQSQEGRGPRGSSGDAQVELVDSEDPGAGHWAADLDDCATDSASAADDGAGAPPLAFAGAGSAVAPALGDFASRDGSAPGDGVRRRGVHVTLLAEAVEVIGEKGTKVPNISIREIALEVEAAFSAVLEYDPQLGWQAPERLTFEVLSLERRVAGSNVPLPRALIKTILNLALPPLFTRLLLAALPHELGQYVAGSGEGAALEGELRIAGPSLAAMSADLALSAGDVPPGKADPKTFAQELRASQRARGMLGLHEAEAWAALAPLLTQGPACLWPDARQGPMTAAELCRFYSTCSPSPAWPDLLAALQPAAAAAAAAGSAPAADLPALLTGPVAALARKPVRVSLAVGRVEAGVEVGPALAALRDYFERLAREFAKNAKGEDAALLLQRPLAAQLQVLDLWHDGLQAALRRFSARFVSAAAALSAAADARQFRLGLDGAHYEGPARLQLPLDVLMSPDHAFMLFKLALPDPRLAARNFAARLRYVFDRLSLAAFGVAATAAAAAAEAGAEGSGAEEDVRVSDLLARDDLPPELAAGLQRWSSLGRAASGASASGANSPRALRRTAAAAASWSAAGAGAGGAAGAGLPPPGSPLRRSVSASAAAASPPAAGGAPPLLSSPTIGHLALRRLAVALRLDERRVAELLTDAVGDGCAAGGGAIPGIAASLLGCFGDLLRAELTPTWPSDAEAAAAAAAAAQDGAGDAAAAPAAAPPPRAAVALATNDVCRARLDVDALAFESAIPPRAAARLLQALTVAVAERFWGAGRPRVEWLGALFKHIEEYLGRESLDVSVSLAARAEAVRGGTGNGAAAEAPRSSADGLRLHVSGPVPAGGGGARRTGSLVGGGRSEDGEGGAPAPAAVHVTNDFDLLTVLDTVQLFMS